MAYLLDLFTPETWNAFRESAAGVTHESPSDRARRLSTGVVTAAMLTDPYRPRTNRRRRWQRAK